MTARGGRIPPDGRPAQAKGVGKNAKRHDLERPATPGLHDSDLQQGDVQAMEQGQRIAPASTQQRGLTPPQSSTSPRTQQMGIDSNNPGGNLEIPDPIDFLAEQNGNDFTMPKPQRKIDESRALTWLPILRQLANGPGASPALVNAFINQARRMQQHGGQPATIVDMNAADEGIEEMLNVGVVPEIARQTMEQADDGTETSSMQLPDQEPATKAPSGVE